MLRAVRRARGVASLWRGASSQSPPTPPPDAPRAPASRWSAGSPVSVGGGAGGTPGRWQDSVSARVADALSSPPTPDFELAVAALAEAAEEGRPLSPSLLSSLLRRLARSARPALILRVLDAAAATAHALRPVHLSIALVGLGVAGHTPGVLRVVRALGEAPGRVPPPAHTRVIAALLACGQYDRALRALDAVRAAAAVAGADVGPVVWGVLDSIASVARRTSGWANPGERRAEADAASARARAAADVLVRHYAIAVEPTPGEASALLTFLTHGDAVSPYAPSGASLDRARAFAASARWHRDYGLDPARCAAVDPALSMPPAGDDAAPGAEEWAAVWGRDAPAADAERAVEADEHEWGAPAAGAAAAAEAEGASGDSAAAPGDARAPPPAGGAPAAADGRPAPAPPPPLPPLAPLAPLRLLSPDHGEWMEVLAHALCSQRLAAAAEPHALALALEALARHTGPYGGVEEEDGPRIFRNNSGRAVDTFSRDAALGLAGLTLGELAAGHVAAPYWAAGRSPEAVLWRADAPGSLGPAALPTAGAAGAPPPEPPVAVAVVPDSALAEGFNRVLPPSPAHLAFVRSRSPAVRLALAAAGLPPPPGVVVGGGAEGAAGAGAGAGAAAGAAVLPPADAERVLVLAPSFGSLSPTDFLSAWSPPVVLNRMQRGERLTRVVAGLYCRMVAGEAAARARRAARVRANAAGGTGVQSARHRPYGQYGPLAAAEFGDVADAGGGGGGGIGGGDAADAAADGPSSAAAGDADAPGAGADAAAAPAASSRSSLAKYRVSIGVHEHVFYALSHRGKTVAATQVAAHILALFPFPLANAGAASGVALGLTRLLPRAAAAAHVDWLFRDACASVPSVVHFVAKQAFYASTGGAHGSGSGPGATWPVELIEQLVDLDAELAEAGGRARKAAEPPAGAAAGAAAGAGGASAAAAGRPAAPPPPTPAQLRAMRAA